ncbi:MAG: putative porin [Alphaproteobacteria bacterium]|jgi:predicted porin
MIGGRFKVASVASVAAAGLFMGGVAAQSADLGGNCCADLEERVAELEATTARKGNRKQSLTIYGQVNKAIVWHDDADNGAAPQISIRDNNGRSGTRFGFRGSAKINADLSAGFHIEIGVDNGHVANFGDGNVQTRKTQVSITSKSLGSVRAGRINQATEGVTEIKLGGAMSGLLASAENADVSQVAAFVAGHGFDGSRYQGAVYQTPTIGGFVASAGWYHSADSDVVGQHEADVALRYAGEFGAIRVAAGIGYRVKANQASAGPDEKTIEGSASVLHVPTGLFLNAAAGQVDDATTPTGTKMAVAGLDHSGWGVGGGIVSKWNSLGSTTLEVQYAEYDTARINVNPVMYGVGISQNIDAAAMDIYVNWQHFDCDFNCSTTNPSAKDSADYITAGARVRF